MSELSAIIVSDLRMSYLGAEVLHGVSTDARSGALTLLAGPSGSGKTTLLNLVGALDRPDSGSIVVSGIDVSALHARARTAFRSDLGLVFQRSGLIRGLTARENIEVPHVLSDHKIERSWVNKLATDLGVADVLDQSSQTLSGGQAQRIAVVRALAHRPAVVLADEPTASVDAPAKVAIHQVLKSVARNDGAAVLLVSHEAMSTEYADVTVTLEGGTITARHSVSDQIVRRGRGAYPKH